MTDYFALLNEPRRPWSDPNSLKAKFLALSAEMHPDRAQGESEAARRVAHERYTELNSAYNCLREPKDRLLHLLQLESGKKPKEVQEIPPVAVELFLEVARVCREIDSFLAKRAAVTSPLLKVQAFERSQAWIDELNALQQQIHLRRDKLIEDLKAMNTAWEKVAAAGVAEGQQSLPLVHLEQVYRALSFIARWTSQIQERVVQLAF
jgi:molecular chaperone HscB